MARENKLCSCVSLHRSQLRSTDKEEEKGEEGGENKQGPPHGKPRLHTARQGKGVLWQRAFACLHYVGSLVQPPCPTWQCRSARHQATIALAILCFANWPLWVLTRGATWFGQTHTAALSSIIGMHGVGPYPSLAGCQGRKGMPRTTLNADY